jgi:uncharacterized membrane protein
LRGGGELIHVLAWLFFLGFLALVALGVVLLWRRGDQSASAASASVEQALATVRMRYAKGEMTREEFVQASADLGSPVPPE